MPAQWKDSLKINTEFFLQIGSPGGAAKMGPTQGDHPQIAALAPKSE